MNYLASLSVAAGLTDRADQPGRQVRVAEPRVAGAGKHVKLAGANVPDVHDDVFTCAFVQVTRHMPVTVRSPGGRAGSGERRAGRGAGQHGGSEAGPPRARRGAPNASP